MLGVFGDREAPEPPPPPSVPAVSTLEIEAEPPPLDVELHSVPPTTLPEDTLLLSIAEREDFFEERQVVLVGEGRASYYGRRFAGRQTASGERFNPSAYTAAHRTLPFGSRIRVTNLHNDREVVVRINDRGPYAHGRIIDLSRAAAQALGFIHAGTAAVRLELLPDE